jgi:nucleoside-triphosphatase
VRHGRYGVDLACLEKIGVPAITEAVVQKRLVIIDELGPIEGYSEAFRHAVLAALDSPVPVIGTIALKPHPWLDRIKQHARVKTSVLTVDNREALSQDFLRFAQIALS